MKQEFIFSKTGVRNFAKEILPKLATKGVLCLNGELGAGKTFFTSEVIKLLMKDENLNITSPTFNIVNVYNASNGKSIHHFDLYRLKNENELENIGFFESLEEGICIIEWSNKFPDIEKKFLQNGIFIDILSIGKNKRKFIVYV
jgi:tRNA threonylcarbamoyladenosine biosynthesis protein TsaE